MQWTGTTIVGADWALFVGEGGIAPAHRHPVTKVCVALDGTLTVDTAEGTLRERVVVVPVNRPHAVQAMGPVAIFYSLSEAELAAADPRRPVESRSALASDVRDAIWKLRTHPANADTVARSITEELLGSHTPGDPRVRRALRELEKTPSASVTSIAETLSLSEGRVAHIFQRTGVTLARYRRWAKLRAAVRSLAAGSNATEAAHSAGFADSSHLTRTAVEMLGISPRVLLRQQLVAFNALA